MARIAIDARPLTHPVDGIGRYTLEVVSRLLLDPDHEWFLYAHAVPRCDLRQASCRIAPRLFQNSLAVSQCLFPAWATEDKVDVLWSPRHHLPLSMSSPGVVTVHDICWLKEPQTMPWSRRITERLLMPSSLSKAKVIAAVSESTARDVCEQWPQFADKVEVIKPGRPEASNTLPKTNKRPYILSVGTIEPRKNQTLLIKAYAEIAQQIPHDLTIVGQQGWHGIDLLQQVRELGLEQRVHLKGHLTDDDLAHTYQSADLLAAPSVYEGFNLPILEAISHNIPVVATDIPVHKEVAGSCALYASFDASAFAGAMLQALTDPEVRNRLVAHCPDTAARYDWDNTAAQTLSCLLAPIR